VSAQKLYESLGWKLDEQFRSYVLTIKDAAENSRVR